MIKVSLKEKIRLSIQDDIIAGRVRPGDRLDERLIAERHKVSRTPVREAINGLAINGLVELHDSRGAFVTRFTVTRVVQMLEGLTILESACAELAAQRIDAAMMDRLRDACQRGEGIMAREEFALYAAFNEEFHHLIYKASRNSFLQDQATHVAMLCSPYQKAAFETPREIANSIREHGEIVAAIGVGDADTASKLMKQHINPMRDDHAGFLMRISRLTEGEPSIARDEAIQVRADKASKPRRSRSVV